MPFDGVNYQRAALSPPIHAHPNAPAVGDALHDGLVGAYMTARKHAQYLGCTTYRQFLRNRFANTTLPGQVSATTWVDVGQVELYVPAFATHVGCVAYFRAMSAEPSFVHARCEIDDVPAATPDTGSDFTREIPAHADTAMLPVSGRHAAGSRVATFVPYFFRSQRAEAYVAVSNVTVGARIQIKCEMYLVGESGAGVVMKPEFCTFWWWTDG